MTELLDKFYEYYIKKNFQDQVNIDDNSEFYSFYKMIINEYNLSKDEQMKIDMKKFFDFFDKVDMFGMRRSFYSTSGFSGKENSK